MKKIPAPLYIGKGPEYRPFRDFWTVHLADRLQAQISNQGRACTHALLLYLMWSFFPRASFKMVVSYAGWDSGERVCWKSLLTVCLAGCFFKLPLDNSEMWHSKQTVARIFEPCPRRDYRIGSSGLQLLPYLNPFHTLKTGSINDGVYTWEERL